MSSIARLVPCLHIKGPVTLPKRSRKRMNRAQISSLTRYIRDFRIAYKFFLSWNLRSCPPMFARSALSRDSRFSAAQNSALRKSLHCIAHVESNFLRISYANNAQNMRRISVIFREKFQNCHYHVHRRLFTDD
jgi:hypothetical protein